jgi:hypothetical protein
VIRNLNAIISKCYLRHEFATWQTSDIRRKRAFSSEDRKANVFTGRKSEFSCILRIAIVILRIKARELLMRMIRNRRCENLFIRDLFNNLWIAQSIAVDHDA